MKGRHLYHVSIVTFIKTSKRTHGRNDLSLHAVLVLEAGSKVADTTPLISGDIWNLADVIEHVATGKQENGNKADSCPSVAVLDDGEDIRPSDKRSGDASRKNHGGHNPLDPVDRSLHRRVRAVRKMAGDPGVHLFGGLRSEMISRRP